MRPARADQLAAGGGGPLGSRPMLCDLISAQAAVLERNVSPQVAAQYKRASIAGITALGGLMADADHPAEIQGFPTPCPEVSRGTQKPDTRG